MKTKKDELGANLLLFRLTTVESDRGEARFQGIPFLQLKSRLPAEIARSH